MAAFGMLSLSIAPVHRPVSIALDFDVIVIFPLPTVCITVALFLFGNHLNSIPWLADNSDAPDTPWMTSMPTTVQQSAGSASHAASGEPPTFAAFSPASSTYSPALFKQRQTILVHQKSPLLVATPPQITRALAYSHPFLLPLNKLVGLLSWTTDDPWESFLLIACFWGIVIYGDYIIRWAGPVLVVAALIMAMYTRRYSPLSSTWASKENAAAHQRKDSDSSALVRHHKSLDEIVDTLKVFTSRCNLLLDPFLRLTDFLSTQRTATTASTRPSLMTLLLRILLISPLWYLLTLAPLRLITTKRVILTIGTITLSWHSRPARISRVILWRSRFVRRTVSLITGLNFPGASKSATPNTTAAALAASKAKLNAALQTSQREGIRFSFTLFENQRRWLGIGWTSSMLAYERAAWTDEELNPSPSKENFELPEVEGGVAKWRWCEGSRWVVEGLEEEDNAEDEGTAENQNAGQTENKTTTSENKKPAPSQSTSTGQSGSTPKATVASRERVDVNKASSSDGGWVYYDTKWRFPRRGQDGWGKYTRRRKWVRDAELIEVTPAATPAAEAPPSIAGAELPATPRPGHKTGGPGSIDDTSSISSKRRSGAAGWFTRGSRATSKASATTAVDDSESGSFSLSVADRDADEDDNGYVPMPFRGRQGAVEASWGVGEDVGMELG